ARRRPARRDVDRVGAAAARRRRPRGRRARLRAAVDRGRRAIFPEVRRPRTRGLASVRRGMRPLVPLCAALLTALVLTPLAMRLAHRVGAVDRPKKDRWSSRVTPLLGGIALTAGILVALFVGREPDAATWAVAGGVLLLHLVGVLDDVRGVRPQTKL